jgi:hypothetical protein
MRTYTFTSKGEVGLDVAEWPQHENAYPFEGVLCRVDEASTKPPNGAEGHVVILPRAVVQRRLGDLVGMPLNVDPRSGYQDHNKTHPIGTLLSAEIQGKNVVVRGILHAKYWPEELAVIRAHKDALGMSYEVGSVELEDEQAKVWRLKDFRFTGASVLLKSAAAYGSKTSISASTAPRDTWTPAMRTLRQQAQALRWR